MTSSTAGLRLTDLRVTIDGNVVVDGLTTTVRPGTALTVTGPPASGKSTLIAMIAGDREPDHGSVTLDDNPVHHETTRRRIGFAPQQITLLDELTATENVALPLLSDGVPAAIANRRAHELLNRLGLPAGAHSNLTEQLSGGQRQRVAVARAVAGDPVLLVADDPTSELDPDTAQRVADLLADLRRRGTITITATNEADPPAFGQHIQLTGLRSPA